MITYETRPHPSNPTIEHRFVCQCGTRGGWLASAEKAQDHAAGHARRHIARGVEIQRARREVTTR